MITFLFEYFCYPNNDIMITNYKSNQSALESITNVNQNSEYQKPARTIYLTLDIFKILSQCNFYILRYLSRTCHNVIFSFLICITKPSKISFFTFLWHMSSCHCSDI